MKEIMKQSINQLMKQSIRYCHLETLSLTCAAVILAPSVLTAMVDEAFARFDIRAARVIHRVGLLQAREQIVLVLVASAHRGQAFQACEFLMDYLKTQAPFWKKEFTPDGAHWVDAREADDAALARWGITAGNAA